jgi:hypothetical protein
MGAWDGFESSSENVDFVELKETGESFEGTIVEVTSHTTAAGTFPGQKEDTVSPQLVFEDEGEGEKRFTAFNTVVKNKLIDLAPEPGTRIKITRLGKPKGKNYIDWDVKEILTAPKREAKGVDTKEEF